ncbi:hypothetical protein FRUB_03800 [Fimbriiglobus ruber]|uniref:Uncharacterized protein n=1 Tax=Fimbriiglobus ruber TaxID=1908690 RepID=A0A225DK26_9BACT|nr:hypothetical protein FRUB_03800 [Fimbriiglobus ruber]
MCAPRHDDAKDWGGGSSGAAENGNSTEGQNEQGQESSHL